MVGMLLRITFLDKPVQYELGKRYTVVRLLDPRTWQLVSNVHDDTSKAAYILSYV